MSNREIVLRLDERWYKALNRHLKNETLEEHMEDVLDELCNQLPQREYEHISREIWQEDQESRQARDTEQKIAVFHVTENGESVYFSVAEPMELLQTAVHLRNCLSDENADTKFTAMFPHKEKISQEQFDAAASERMENTGRVTGAYELDFDARTFSALNIIDGWKVYAMQDVADAARQAFQDAEVSEHERWCIFIDRLDGQELTTPSRLTMRNFHFEDSRIADQNTFHQKYRLFHQASRTSARSAAASCAICSNESSFTNSSIRLRVLPSCRMISRYSCHMDAPSASGKRL